MLSLHIEDITYKFIIIYMKRDGSQRELGDQELTWKNVQSQELQNGTWIPYSENDD